MKIIDNYKKLGHKEFISRWKKGIQNITPLQQARTTLWGQFVIIVGIIWGLYFSTTSENFWLSLILVGSLIAVSMQILGTYQKILLLRQVDSMMNNFQTNETEVEHEQTRADGN